MEKEYGAKKGESVFYASANAGKITGVHGESDMAKDQYEPPKQNAPGTEGQGQGQGVSMAYRQAAPDNWSLAEVQKRNKEFWEQSVTGLVPDRTK